MIELPESPPDRRWYCPHSGHLTPPSKNHTRYIFSDAEGTAALESYWKGGGA